LVEEKNKAYFGFMFIEEFWTALKEFLEEFLLIEAIAFFPTILQIILFRIG